MKSRYQRRQVIRSTTYSFSQDDGTLAIHSAVNTSGNRNPVSAEYQACKDGEKSTLTSAICTAIRSMQGVCILVIAVYIGFVMPLIMIAGAIPGITCAQPYIAALIIASGNMALKGLIRHKAVNFLGAIVPMGILAVVMPSILAMSGPINLLAAAIVYEVYTISFTYLFYAAMGVCTKEKVRVGFVNSERPWLWTFAMLPAPSDKPAIQCLLAYKDVSEVAREFQNNGSRVFSPEPGRDIHVLTPCAGSLPPVFPEHLFECIESKIENNSLVRTIYRTKNETGSGEIILTGFLKNESGAVVSYDEQKVIPVNIQKI